MVLRMMLLVAAGVWCSGRAEVIRLRMPAPLQVTRVLTAQDVATELERLRELSPSMAVAPLKDRSYGIISQASFEEYRKFWKARSEELRKSFGGDESNDCDNFALAARLFANMAAMRARSAEPVVGIATVFHVLPWATLPPTFENHEVLLFYTERGWFVMEPQNAHVGPLATYPNRDRMLFLTLH